MRQLGVVVCLFLIGLGRVEAGDPRAEGGALDRLCAYIGAESVGDSWHQRKHREAYRVEIALEMLANFQRFLKKAGVSVTSEYQGFPTELLVEVFPDNTFRLRALSGWPGFRSVVVKVPPESGKPDVQVIDSDSFSVFKVKETVRGEDLCYAYLPKRQACLNRGTQGAQRSLYVDAFSDDKLGLKKPKVSLGLSFESPVPLLLKIKQELRIVITQGGESAPMVLPVHEYKKQVVSFGGDALFRELVIANLTWEQFKKIPAQGPGLVEVGPYRYSIVDERLNYLEDLAHSVDLYQRDLLGVSEEN